MADPDSPTSIQPLEEAERTPIPHPAEGADAVVEQAGLLADMVADFLTRLQQPWTLYQMGIILGLIFAAYCLKVVFRPRIRTSLAQGGHSKTTLRFASILVARLDLIFFSALAWSTYAIMQSITWPSRSYFIYIVASIALAWLAIAILSRLISNNTVRVMIRTFGWAYAALRITGLWENTSALLESLAIETEGFRLSVLMVLTALFALAILFVMANFLTKSTHARLNAASDISPSIKVLMQKIAQIGFYGVALLIGLKTVGFDLSNFALLTGAIGLGLGFGLQKIVSNLVSGVIILLDKSIKPGDVISLGNTFGWITSLGARYASITTRDGREYLVPNEDFITNQVVNWTHSSDFVRLDILFGVSYDSDPHFVKRIASEAPKSVGRVVSTPAPVCHIINFGDSSIDFKLRFWIKDPTSGLTNIRGNVYLALWDALKENDIQIPYPRRDVHIHTELPED
ncbi:mechanosensitive ion channel protein [Amylibacter marinus]|uniref:Mechanosensitive ion channel protein n=1 Tax=Amylibacter marinus TaxID=1475483 RepID=A0ABQ5VWK9_9RHOB|nr:mechanosensitive ion channel domain-containing protein [Amylibacter marinus]GLQ35441.1 mechanosensitive ion channel protein [Amylibacter marinus]